MTSKERVIAALARQPVDRPPIFMWFHPSTAKRLAALLEIPAAHVAEAMANDITQTWVNNNWAMEGIVHEHDGEGHTDPWGIQWVKQDAFNQIVYSPLAHAEPEALLDYPFPWDHLDALLANMEPVMQHAGTRFTGVDVSPCCFEMYNRIRGMEAALLDLVANPEIADRLIARCAEFARVLSEKACDRFKPDWLWTGDDVAGQHALFMSPACWRDQIKPHLATVTAAGLQRNLPVAYHCCGALRPIIPDLIEIGIRILNPVQCNCPGMDAADLKRDFGHELTFMGGVDTQGLLPNGSPEEVRRATERLIHDMTTDGGGYILAASHTVPPETPEANLFALYQAAGVSREEIFDRAAAIRARETTSH